MIKRGEIYLVDLGDHIGSEQGGIRPAIILQNDIGNKYSSTTLICPLTSKVKKQMPTHVPLTPSDCGIKKDSTALCEQITVIDKELLMKKIGEIHSNNTILEINKKIMISLGIVPVQV